MDTSNRNHIERSRWMKWLNTGLRQKKYPLIWIHYESPLLNPCIVVTLLCILLTGIILYWLIFFFYQTNFFMQWPFIRVYGMQEPASVLFSIGNGLSQVYFVVQLRRRVPNTVPMYYLGLFQGLVSVQYWMNLCISSLQCV